jgi:hypothetical protein
VEPLENNCVAGRECPSFAVKERARASSLEAVPSLARRLACGRLPALLLAFGALLAGCGSKGAVSLTARLDHPSLTAKASALVTGLSGGFDLVLDLGPEAPSATTVSLGKFMLRNAAGVLVDGLPVSPDQAFPLDVGVGKTETAHFTLDPTASAPTDAASEICGGPLWFQGTVQDTLSSGRPTDVASEKISADCP